MHMYLLLPISRPVSNVGMGTAHPPASDTSSIEGKVTP